MLETAGGSPNISTALVFEYEEAMRRAAVELRLSREVCDAIADRICESSASAW
jgi:hypothetical protein